MADLSQVLVEKKMTFFGWWIKNGNYTRSANLRVALSYYFSEEIAGVSCVLGYHSESSIEYSGC